MGEDSCKNQVSVDKKTNGIDTLNHRNGDVGLTNSSTMSTCSELDSESTSFMEDETDMDYQYGPGIVSKLRTKFLSITLKQNRGNSIRRSCSLENLLDPKPSQRNTNSFVPPNRFLTNGTSEKSADTPWSNLKRAKSMDTLLLSLESSQTDSAKADIVNTEFKTFKEPKVIRRKDGPLTRPVVSITDEEFPKPDTVKTYKRMFEPAESKKANSNSNIRRRPPVLRATAKSGSNSNIKSGLPNNNKQNGVIAPKTISVTNNKKPSAKETAVSDLVPKSTKIESKTKVKFEEKTPVKDNIYQKKTITKDSPPASDLITNGTIRAEALQLKVKDEIAKRNNRATKLENNRTKPSVPLRKPSLKTSARYVAAQTTANKAITNKLTKFSPDKSPKNVIKTVNNTEKTTSKPEDCNKITLAETKKVSETVTPVQEDKKVIKELKNAETQMKLLNGFTKTEKKVESPKDQKLANGISDSKETKRTSTAASSAVNTMVFDFRGKDVVSHLTISPAPFGCKAAIRKRNVLIDGKESMPYLNGYSNGGEMDMDDEDYVDYSVPPPCGLSFEGENVKIGKGSILSTRNKDLKIQFDEDVEKSTFVYPSESSMVNDDDASSLSSSDFSSLDSVDVAKVATNGNTHISPKLPSNTAINPSGTGGLMSYTPSVLRTVDNFQPGLFRAQEEKKMKPEETEGEEENRERNSTDGATTDDDSGMLKPAEPEFISSWSISAGTSDLLF